MRLGSDHFLRVDPNGLRLNGPRANLEFGDNLSFGSVGSDFLFGNASPAPTEFATVAFNYDFLGGPSDWHA